VAVRNIDIVLGGLADAMRSGDPERIAEFLGPDLVWEGVEPGLRCDGRHQAMSVIRNRFAAAPFTVEAVEAIDAGQHVIVGLRGPGFNGTPGDLQTVGQIFNVFTFSEGKVVRWRDFLTRREALAAANAKDQPWQLKSPRGSQRASAAFETLISAPVAAAIAARTGRSLNLAASDMPTGAPGSSCAGPAKSPAVTMALP
jgi:limonene-1,2-epoxide hydrolase